MEEPDVLQKPKNRTDPIRRTYDVNIIEEREQAHLGAGPAVMADFGPEPSNVPVRVLGLSCENPGGFGAPRLHDSERTPNVCIRSRRFKHHRNSTRRHPERHKKSEMVAGEEKKREILGAPPFGATLQGPTFPKGVFVFILFFLFFFCSKVGLAKVGRMAKVGLPRNRT